MSVYQRVSKNPMDSHHCPFKATEWYTIFRCPGSHCIDQHPLHRPCPWLVRAGTRYETLLFFRPSPSRLSPGRNTVFVPVNELCIAYQHPSLGSQKRARTITQSRIHPGCERKRGNPKTNKTGKQQPQTKTPKSQPNKRNKKIPVRWTCSAGARQLVCQ